MQKLFTCGEAAELLSVKIKTIYDWIKSGKLSAYKIGRTYRISEEQINAIFKQNL